MYKYSMYACMYTCIKYIYTCKYKCRLTHTHTHTTHTRTHIHTHTHTHTHTKKSITGFVSHEQLSVVQCFQLSAAYKLTQIGY